MSTFLIVAFALIASGDVHADVPQQAPAEANATAAAAGANEVPGQCKLETARRQSASGPWLEEVDYTKLDPPQPTTSGSKIEVVEFFAYWCPQCSQLEPEIEAWSGKAPDVALVQVPLVLMNEYSRRYATLYYSFMELGRPDLHRAFFEAVEHSRRSGDGNLMSIEHHRAFARSAGIDAALFDRVYQSAEVAAAVARAEAMTREYAVSHAPAIVVQGWYRIEKNPERGTGDLLRLADFLIDRVRGEGSLQASRVIRDSAE